VKKLMLSLVLSLLCVGAAAQTAVVTRNVNLRPDSSSHHAPMATLKPGAQLTLLDHTTWSLSSSSLPLKSS
jgi:hypothetical protein